MYIYSSVVRFSPSLHPEAAGRACGRGQHASGAQPVTPGGPGAWRSATTSAVHAAVEQVKRSA